MGNPTFATLWAAQHVHEKTCGAKKFNNSVIGQISLHYETFYVPASDDHSVLVIYAAAPNSVEQDLLDRLTASTADQAATPNGATTTRPSISS